MVLNKRPIDAARAPSLLQHDGRSRSDSHGTAAVLKNDFRIRVDPDGAPVGPRTRGETRWQTSPKVLLVEARRSKSTGDEGDGNRYS